MKIIVNARMLLKDKLDGVGWFAFQILKRITSTHPEIEFIFLFDRKYDQEFIFSNNIKPMVVWPPTRHPLLYYIWFQISVKNIIKKIKPDLFLSLDGMIILNSECKQLSVIHDINFKHYPKDLKFLTAKYFNHYFPKYVQQATGLATVSEYSKQDIIKEYRADPKKIDLVYNGVNENFTPISDETKNETRKRYTDGKPYFIFVGSIHPRKNIIRLLQAFEQFKNESNSEIKLVLAGAYFWGKTKINKTLNKMNHKNDVIFTGRISTSSLTKLMASALCLTYVPYFEGFGVPLLEAMQSEVPIISANVTSMPEVAGDAALYVNPLNVQEIKNAMLTIVKDEKLQKTLIENGKKQRQKFSWDKSAEQMWKCIEKTISS